MEFSSDLISVSRSFTKILNFTYYGQFALGQPASREAFVCQSRLSSVICHQFLRKCYSYSDSVYVLRGVSGWNLLYCDSQIFHSGRNDIKGKGGGGRETNRSIDLTTAITVF